MSEKQSLPAVEGQWRILAIDDEAAVHETYDAIFSEKLEDELEEIESLVGLMGMGEEETDEEISDAARFRLDHAMGGEEGCEMFARAAEAGDPYAVIYLDMRMPAGWDGLKTAEKIREIDSEARIILITAYMDYSLTEIRERIGVNFDFLTKPVNVNELLQLTLSLATQWSQARDLVVALERAEAASKAKDDFLASMSHELRTPLTAIIGNSELMEESGLTDEQQGLMHSIEISSRGLLALINDILDLSKIESGKFQIDHVDFDLNLLLDDLEQTFSQQARDAGLSLTLKQKAEFPMQFVGDGRRIGQILINLLSNAIKFTEQGEIILEVWQQEGQLHFVVEDSGIGMPQEVQERLFKPFEQADQSISRRYGGTGLGLHISATLAKLMKGAIEVSSREGEGSRFELWLPCELSKEPVSAVKAQNRLSGSERFSGKVLVAEDTVELQLLERKILEAAGAEVTVANNGREAVELGLATPFDLILMDMQMPEMDGIEATQMMRSVGNETPIVALTANVMQQHREQFEAAGCNGFLSKPIDRASLIDMLRQYLQIAEPAYRFQGQVLVAESDVELQTALREMLESTGVAVTVANDGNEAVEQGLAAPFDLVLMSLQMSGMGGVEAAQLMRSVGCESPMVMVAEEPEQHWEEIQAAGGNASLSRPVDRTSLMELLGQYLQVVEPTRCFKGQVLVAEDSPELQIVERKMLEAAGVEVTIANNGKEAVEHGLATPFDLVLMDMQMPEMGGVEATQLMRSVGCESPIVMMSGDAEQQRAEIEAAGCNTALPKPIEKETLLALLEEYLEEVDPNEVGQQQGAADNFVDEELMQLFIDRTRLQRGLIMEALEGEDWGEVRAIAHTVKGSGATFGYPEITRLGKEICDGLDNNEPEPVPDLVRELTAEMDKI